jgi:transposase
MPKVARPVVLSESSRELLQGWVRAQFTPQQVVLRSRILLMAADGKQDLEIASELDVNRHTPALWRKRFLATGLDGVWETGSGRGRKPSFDQDKVAAMIEATLQTKPKGSTHWSCRTFARAQKVSKNTVNRLWQDYNLKPHRTQSFKLSRDIRFLEKLTDVVGLYLNPPAKSLVLCIDEKSQIQALDRTQPGLPLKKGRCGTFTHDYVRHGTTTLFAALEVLDGKVIGVTRHVCAWQRG